MKIAYFVRFVCCCMLGLMCLAYVAMGQTETATISGLVTDETGAVVPGAEVKLQSVDRGTVQSTITNNTGIYVFANVQPGQYQIRVQKAAFKQVDFLGLIINVQDHIEQNFRLQIGSVSESVTVNANDIHLNTTDAAVSTVVDQTYIKNMPLNGRSFQDLILLTPGTMTPTPQPGFGPSAVGQTGEFSVNGQRTESNYYTVDGVSANVGATQGLNMTSGAGASGSVSAATALGTTQALVSVDALQEFRVQSSTYSAEYGRNPGGQFSFETKSGTNQWHGTAYDYLRNGFFDAQDWFNDYFHVPEPAIRQNDFGGTLGGPVRIPHLYNGKDKTFFFVSYEGLRLTSPQPASVNFVPDAALRASAPAPLNQALNAYPLPTGLDFGDGIAQYVGSWSNPSSIDSTSVRFDHAVNDKLRFFFRFSDTGSSSSRRGTDATGDVPTMVTTTANTLRTYTAGVSSVFSSRLTNEFRLNYSANDTTLSQVIGALGGSTPVDLAQLAGLASGSDVAVILCYGESSSCPALEQQRQSGAQRQWNLVDTASLSMGRHQFRFGLDYRRLAPFATLGSPFSYYEFDDPSSVTTNSSSADGGAFSSAYPLYTNFSAFAQDQWKVSQRLSLSLGLRWEVNPAPGVTQGLKPYTIQGASPDTWTLAPQGTPLWQTAWFNFAPRLGIAYILHEAPGRETVVRVGGGVFFDTGQQLGSIGFYGGPGFSSVTCCPTLAFPSPIAIPAIVNPPLPLYSPIPHGFASHLQLPYTLQWNTSVEQALGRSQALTLSYVGSHASRLLQLNQFSTPSNPNARAFLFVRNGLTSDYDALQLQFRRRLTGGLTALASYTWSHCSDYSSSNVDYGYQRGSCDFDVRHNLSTAFSYELPNVGHNGFANAVLHHWGFDDRFTARTAFPVTLRGRRFAQTGTGLLYFAGLNIVADQPVYLYGENCASVLQGLGDLQPGQGCPGGQAINPLAFTNVTSGFGNAPRNFARGLGAWQMDMAVRREFPIHEGLRLQFRAEAFNVFNHPNFGSVHPFFGQGTFGQFTGTLASSPGVLNSLYRMGGPRSMQFALKLVF